MRQNILCLFGGYNQLAKEQDRLHSPSALKNDENGLGKCLDVQLGPDGEINQDGEEDNPI